MTYLTFGESIPIPKATVVTTIRTASLGSVKDAIIFFLVFGEEQAVNFSHTCTVCLDSVAVINNPEFANSSTSSLRISELSLYIR